MKTGMELKNDSIDKFWKHFILLSTQIMNSPEDDQVIGSLDSAVNDLGDFDWEYGPASNAEYYFCLSPSLQKEKLEVVERIIACAPSIRGWEFLVGKPPKAEQLTEWQLEKENGESVEIKTEGWRCVIYSFPDKSIELDIKTIGLDEGDETNYVAAEIHLVNLLGELTYMKLITHFDLVSEFEASVSSRSVLLKDLPLYLSRFKT